MPVDRRRFLAAAAASAATAGLPPVLAADAAQTASSPQGPPDWEWVRAQFDARRDLAHFASFYIASHPRPVREAIEGLRRAIDENPFEVVEHGLFERPHEVRAAAAAYLGGTADEVALVRSTTEGLAHLYTGLALRPGQEVLTTTHDHYSHHESIRLAAEKAGATVRKVALHDDPAAARVDEMADRLRRALSAKTRVVGVTWVHSSTGLKLPIRRLAEVVRAANAGRSPGEETLLVVDGVHGLGVEDETVAQMGCDFFVAGTHKWIFGPRGTGVVWGRREAWAAVRPTVPSFEMPPYEAWLDGLVPGSTQAPWMSPGGFHAYEHLWALPAAFAFHARIGRSRVAARIHALNAQLKDGLAAMGHVKLLTPRDPALSAGLVVFEVAGRTAEQVVRALHERKVVASTSPYKPTFPRLAGSLLNTPQEVEQALGAVRALA